VEEKERGGGIMECEGLIEEEKRLRIRSLLRDWKVDIVCLQETKLEFISSEVIHSLWDAITGPDVFGVKRGIE
jgi:endonuclease/exonuclease/phosphatase family metal-dependent hydrolase